MATVVRLDKISGAEHIYSGVASTELENGRVLALGALQIDGESFAVDTPADITTDKLVFHASVPMQYDERATVGDFKLPAGKAGRFYELVEGDIVTITDDGIAGSTVVGEYVVPQNGDTKLKATATLEGEKLVFKVIAKEDINFTPATVLLVVSK